MPFVPIVHTVRASALPTLPNQGPGVLISVEDAPGGPQPTDTSAPRWSYDKFADACAWLRSQADAGVFELTTYSKSTAMATGRTWVK